MIVCLGIYRIIQGFGIREAKSGKGHSIFFGVPALMRL